MSLNFLLKIEVLMLKGVDSPSLSPQVRMVRRRIYKAENTYAWQSQDYLTFRLCLRHMSPRQQASTPLQNCTHVWLPTRERDLLPHIQDFSRISPLKVIRSQIQGQGSYWSRGHFFCRKNTSREEWRKQEEKRQACGNGASGRGERLEKVVGWSIYSALRTCVKLTSY